MKNFKLKYIYDRQLVKKQKEWTLRKKEKKKDKNLTQTLLLIIL